MIQLFEVDEPTSLVEVPPTTLARVIDLMAYLTENTIKYIGEPVELQEISVLDAIALEPDEKRGEYTTTIFMRARTREEIQAASRMQ